MSEAASICKFCNQEIFWHKSKAGKSYATNSEDRRDFHSCDRSKAAQPSSTVANPRPAVSTKTIEERVAALENETRALRFKIGTLEAAVRDGIPF